MRQVHGPRMRIQQVTMLVPRGAQRRRWLSTSGSRASAPLPAKRGRSSWRRDALIVGGGSAIAVCGMRHVTRRDPDTSAHALSWPQPWALRIERGLLTARAGWMLGSAFASHTAMAMELWGTTSTVDGELVMTEDERMARRLLWWEAINAARMQANAVPCGGGDDGDGDGDGGAAGDDGGLLDLLVRVLVNLLEESQLEAPAVDTTSLLSSLVERGALGILLEYTAMMHRIDPEIAQRIIPSITRALENSAPGDGTHLALLPLGAALHHLMASGAVTKGDIARFGRVFPTHHRVLTNDMDRYGKLHGLPLFANSAIGVQRRDDAVAATASALVRLLSPENPLCVKEFALSSLTSLLQWSRVTTDRAGHAAALEQAALSQGCADFIAALPRSDVRVQLLASRFINSLIPVAQRAAIPPTQSVYHSWMMQIHGWMTVQSPSIRLEGALGLRTLSSHPRTRHLIAESNGMMDALFAVARQIHNDSTPRSQELRDDTQASIAIQNHLSRAVCELLCWTGVGDNASMIHASDRQTPLSTLFGSHRTPSSPLLPPHTSSLFAKAIASLQSKRSLPMSRVFQGTHDLTDLPVIGADEYEAVTEFGWIDILTKWTQSKHPAVRRNAIDSLVCLIDRDENGEYSTNNGTDGGRQAQILQAWLMSMLQHVRQLSGRGEILAVKQVEDIARLSDELTPGNEKILFNPAVVDAGASALAVLAEQHHDELLDHGVVPLLALLFRCAESSGMESPARLSTADGEPVAIRMQCVRVLANLAVACCQALQAQDPLEKRVSMDISGKKRWPSWILRTYYDIETRLHKTESGRSFANNLRQLWADQEDPMERSQWYRAVANLDAYRDIEQLGHTTLPVYYEGVHPVVPRGSRKDVGDSSPSLTSASDPNNTDPVDLPQPTPIDIVFVHGLRGHPFGTWRTDMDDAVDSVHHDVWPDSLLLDDLKHANLIPRVITLGYEAGMVSWSSPWPSLTLDERSKLMLRALYAANIGRNPEKSDSDSEGARQRRPVVFVTHSMGGLLVKKMLVLSETESAGASRSAASFASIRTSQGQGAFAMVSNSKPISNTLAGHTNGVIFLAVPHFGSDLARGVRSEAVRAVLKTHPALLDLCASGDNTTDRRLETLNDSFRSLNIDCLSVGEALPAPLGFGVSALVVKPPSANPGFGEFAVEPTADHMTICKAKTRDEPLYSRMLAYIVKHSQT